MSAARDPAARTTPRPHLGDDVFWAVPPARDAVLVRGRDAVRFLDGFQTAAVAALAANRGTEAFFTDGRGHVLVLANIFRPAGVLLASADTGTTAEPRATGPLACAPFAGTPLPGTPLPGTPDGAAAAVWIDLPSGAAPGLVEHLEHYHIREDVEFTCVPSGDAPSVFVGGPAAAAWLADTGTVAAAPPANDIATRVGLRFVGSLPREPLEFGAGSLGGVPVGIVRSDRFRGGGTGGSGFEVFANAPDLPQLVAWLSASGLPRIEPAMLEELRILARYPEPRDIPPKTLPQELDRPAAISFTKGCYLGQETVARLDALGHVNRRLVVVAVDGGPPEPPATVLGADDTPVGTITSACRSTRLGCGIGLALVHVKGLAPGATTSVAGQPARILAAEPEIRA